VGWQVDQSIDGACIRVESQQQQLVMNARLTMVQYLCFWLTDIYLCGWHGAHQLQVCNHSKMDG